MNDTDVSIDEKIRSFAASVRGHLDDLPEDELDDILGGLAADLAEQAADNEGVLELGDPAEYAEELRSAAGLPPRGEAVKRAPLRARVREWRTGVANSIRRHPFGAWVLDFLVTLRPVWWVLRGFGMYVVLVILSGMGPLAFFFFTPDTTPLPSSPISWLLLLGLVIVSVQWGRDRWLPKNRLLHVRTVMSVIAVIVLPLATASVLNPRVEYVDTGGYVPQGLLLDGVQINNIFAYDAEGNPIERVQLFTGKGTPINLLGSGYEESSYWTQDDGWTASIPFRDYRDRPVWNIYPLDEAEMSTTTGEPNKSTISRPDLPFLKAPALEIEPSPTPTPTPGTTDPQPAETPAP